MDDKEAVQVGGDQDQVDNSKRNIMAALLGGLGVAALSSCTNQTSSIASDEIEPIKRVAEALTGTQQLRWVSRIGTTYGEDDTCLRDLNGPAHGEIVIAEGFWTPGDGGGGVFYWEETSSTDDGGTIIVPNSNAPVPPNQGSSGACWKRIYSGPLNVKWFGAKGNGTDDDTTAFITALATGGMVYVPYGTYVIKSTLTLDRGALIGEGWGLPAAESKSRLLFYNLTDSNGSAVRTRQATSGLGFPRIENIYIQASSWSSTTGCLGCGLDVEAPVVCRNVYIGGFKRNNLFLHNNAQGLGPYQSLFENVFSAFAGEHGVVVGTGANAVTFINLQSKWCGASVFSTAPTQAGGYDGFVVLRDGDGNPGNAYYSYLPDSVRVIGGDCSYNSRYGWNFYQAQNSHFEPGYAEGNLQTSPGQVNLGLDVMHCRIIMSGIAGGVNGVNFGANYSMYLSTNSVFVNGESCGSGDSNTKRSNFFLGNQMSFIAYSSDLNSQAYLNPDPASATVHFGAVGNAKWNLHETDLYRSGTRVLSARRTGYTNAMTGTADRGTTLDTATVTLQQLAQRVKALEDDLIAHGLIGP